MNPQDTETFEVRLYYSFTVMFGFKPLTCLRLHCFGNCGKSIDVNRDHEDKSSQGKRARVCQSVALSCNQKLQKCQLLLQNNLHIKNAGLFQPKFGSNIDKGLKM